MKKLYLSLTALLLTLAIFSWSESDLTTNTDKDDGSISNPKGDNITTLANPKIACLGTFRSGSTLYNSISVMNSDGTNLTALYYPHVGASSLIFWNETRRNVSWSPSTNEIAFLEPVSLGTTNYMIRKFTVTVVNNIPTATNFTTLKAFTSADSSQIWTIQWSPSTIVPEIAFTKYQYPINPKIDTANRYMSIMTISADGGIPTAIYTEYGTLINSLAWNYDGTKLAVLSVPICGPNKNVRFIKIIERATGQVLNSYNLGKTNITGLNWSKAGMNKLVYVVVISGSAHNLYTLDLDQNNPIPVQLTVNTGANPVTPNWSPDNSKIIFWDNRSYSVGGGARTVDLSTGIVTLLVSGNGVIASHADWK